MGSTFKKSINITGKYKELCVENGKFVDCETGEFIDLANELEEIYGENPFSLQTSFKVDSDLD